MREAISRQVSHRAGHRAQLLAGGSVVMVLAALGAAFTGAGPAAYHAVTAVTGGGGGGLPAVLGPPPASRTPSPAPAHHPRTVSYPAPLRTYPAPLRTYPAPPRKTYPAPVRTYPAPSGPPSSAPGPSPSPTPLPVPGPAQGPLEGVVTLAPGVAGSQGGVKAWDAVTHHKADLAVSYVSMSAPLAPSFIHSVIRVDNGAEPVVEITLGTAGQPGVSGGSSIPLSDVISGKMDPWLTQLRDQITAGGQPVVVSFGPEANGGWYAWGRQPAAFAAAYRHAHQVLGRAGITWLWQMSSIQTADPAPYWPGSQYVDWAGLDGYYYVPGDNFNQRFDTGLAAISKFWSGPVIIGETAVSPATKNVPNDITDLFAGVKAHHLLGLIYFDISQACPAQGCGPFHGDFALQDGPNAWIASFADAVNSPW